MRNHFNISKIHNIKHYVDTIWSHGTTDGYNTETFECLHIDLAKAGYRASNKHNFMIQMMTWLSRQEAVHRFGSFLQWAVGDYKVEMDDEEDEED